MRHRWVVVLAALLVAACGRADDRAVTTSEGPSSSTVTTAPDPVVPLREVPVERRLGAAVTLGRLDLTPREAVDQLGEVLEEETSSPSSGPGFGWYDYSETLQETYMAVMVALGPEAVPEIERRVERAEGVARAWYVIALGYLGEPVDDELLALLDDPPSPPVAAQVMELVGRRRLEEAVPALLTYLENDFSFEDPHRPGRPPDYPLRDHAAAALRTFGYTVYSPPDRPFDYEVSGQ